MIRAVVELSAAFVASDGAGDRSDALNFREAIGANVGVLALHFAAFEGKCMKGGFAGNAELTARAAPFRAMGVDAAAARAFVSDEVCELVLERAPKFVWLTFLEFWVQLDRAVWPPCTASGGPHAWVPGNADFLRQFRKGKGDRRLRAPSAETAVSCPGSVAWGRCLGRNAEP